MVRLFEGVLVGKPIDWTDGFENSSNSALLFAGSYRGVSCCVNHDATPSPEMSSQLSHAIPVLFKFLADLHRRTTADFFDNFLSRLFLELASKITLNLRLCVFKRLNNLRHL